MKKKVLVVVDLQNDFINGALGSAEALSIVPNVKKKIEAYRDADAPVVFTRDTHTARYMETQEGKNLPIPHCIIDSEGWAISKELNLGNSIIFDKNTFGSVELALYLREDADLDFDEVELVGLCTDICVISNALLLKAFMPEIKITVDASCCAGVTQESHKNALSAMKMCQINIINE